MMLALQWDGVGAGVDGSTGYLEKKEMLLLEGSQGNPPPPPLNGVFKDE